MGAEFWRLLQAAPAAVEASGLGAWRPLKEALKPPAVVWRPLQVCGGLCRFSWRPLRRLEAGSATPVEAPAGP